MRTNTILEGDAVDRLKGLPSNSVDCVMTSPPYWGLRDYGTATWEGGNEGCDHIKSALASDKSGLNSGKGVKDTHKVRTFGSPYMDKCGKCGAIRQDKQLGLEPDFRDYIENLCLIFDEIKRVLKPTGTCWVNVGDTYSTVSGNMGPGAIDQPKYPAVTDSLRIKQPKTKLPDKCLVQIPSRFAIAMTNRGWILRNEIIWYKKNVMPQSVKDRFTVDFEKIFFFTKSKKYYFEQQFDKALTRDNIERDRETTKMNNTPGRTRMNGLVHNNYEQRNKRTVWQINPQPYTEAHFAVYPPKLVETPIKAGCPEWICKKCAKPRMPKYEIETVMASGSGRAGNKPVGKHDGLEQTESGSYDIRMGPQVTPKLMGYTDCGCRAGFTQGVVLDPFFGSGTTGLVAEQLNRRWLGIELNPDYIKIAHKRLAQAGLGI